MKRILLCLSVFLTALVTAKAQYSWTELGTGTNALGANLPIWTVTADASGNIYAAGAFTDGSGEGYVAKWNDTTWTELGTDANALNPSFLSSIYAITTDAAGNVYAAGSFTDNSGYYYVAKWDGSSWSELGNGAGAFNSNSYIRALTVDTAGNLYETGALDTPNSEYAYAVSKWNGTSWLPLLGDFNAMHVYDSTYGLATYSNFYTSIITDPAGNVYVGDYLFDTVGYSATYQMNSEIAKWDGTAWTELGTGSNALNFPGTIWALAMDPSGNIYASGYFLGDFDSTDFSYDNERLYVAKWNGTSWAPLDTSGLNGLTFNYVNGMPINNGAQKIASDASGNIYVAGDFIDSAGNEFVAKWNGASWSELGTGTNALKANAPINNITIASGNIYVAGRFTDSLNERYVAMYSSGIDSVVVKTQNNIPASIATSTGTLQLVASVFPATANQGVTWSIVPGTGTATINNTGLVTAQTGGTVWGKAVSVIDPAKMDSLQITISNVSAGINEVTAAKGLTIFPNPAGNMLNIEVANLQTGDAQISVYNVTGALVKTMAMKDNNMSMDVSGLAPGLYLLQYADDNGKIITKFTKD